MAKNLGPGATAWLKSAKPEQIVGFLLKSLNHSLRQDLNEVLRKHDVGLSFAQLATMFGLFFEPGATGAQLARRMSVSAQTMNSLLRHLETGAFIARRPHPESRRADSWFLTEKGSKQLEQARVIGDAVFRRMLAGLSPKEIADFQSYLRHCIAALDGDSAENAMVRAPASSTARRAPRRAAAR
jgi:DNA-binding MarR family transcriptional regulator